MGSGGVSRYLIAETAAEVVPLIRQELEAKGKTQRQLAAHLGFTTKHMSQIMTGKAGASLPVLFRILAYLGVGIAMAPTPTIPKVDQ